MFAKNVLDIWKLSGKYREGLYTWARKMFLEKSESGTCPRRGNKQQTQRVGGETHHPEIPPVVTGEQSAGLPSLASGCPESPPYLFVGSRAGLPEALHFAEGDVCAVGEAAQEGARRLLGESWRHLFLFHGSLRGFAFTQTQGSWLQLIMQLYRINCQVALSWEPEAKGKASNSYPNLLLAKRTRTTPRKQTGGVQAPNQRG